MFLRGCRWLSWLRGLLCCRRLHHHRYRGRRHGWTRWSDGACGRFGNHRTGRRVRCNGRRGRRNNDGRRLARLRNDLARLRASGGGGRRGNHHRWRRLGRDSGRWRSGWLGRHVASPGSLLSFQFLRLDGLKNIPRLGDVRKIDFGRYALGSFMRRGTGWRGRVLAVLKMRANLVGFMIFQ